MKRSTYILFTLCSLFFGLQMMQAQCDNIFQSNSSGSYPVPNARPLAGQTFLANCTGTLNQLIIRTFSVTSDEGGPIPVELKIYKDIFGSNPVLLQDIAIDLPPNSGGGYRTFSINVDVVAGTTYAWTLNKRPDLDVIVLHRSPGTSDIYPDGRAFMEHRDNPGVYINIPGFPNADWFFRLYYLDETPPIASCQNITRYLDANNTVTIQASDVDNGSSDAESSIVNYTLSKTTFNCSNIGDNTVTLTVEDEAGNTATCNATVTILDNIPPTLTCPNDITVTEVAGTPTVITYDDIIATEECAITPPSGYSYLGSWNGNSYYLSNNSSTGAVAFSAAEALNGHLATITNQAQNDGLANALNGIQAWIGYNDLSVEGTFEWHSGSTSTYTNWYAPNNSPNGGASEDYVQMNSVGFWGDQSSTLTRRHILELPSPIIQTTGLSSGSVFPVGETINTFEITDASGNVGTCSFTVTVAAAPETDIVLSGGKLTISDIGNDSLDQIVLTQSPDGNTLTISNLTAPVTVSSGVTVIDDTTVSIPVASITQDIMVFADLAGNGNHADSVTIANGLDLAGTNNDLNLSGITDFTQTGTMNIGGSLFINGNIGGTISLAEMNVQGQLNISGVGSITNTAGPIAISGTTTLIADTTISIDGGAFDNTVTATGSTINIRAINEDLTLGNITATGTATTYMNYIYSEQDIWFSAPVQTAGNSNLTIRGNLVQQASSAAITTNELIVEGNTFDTSAHVLDTAANNVNKLTSNTTNHLTSGILFDDINTVELGIINTGAIYFDANTYTLTETTNLTIGFDSLLNGGINVTATNSSSPAKINHNGGKLTMYGPTSYNFTGAFQYTAVSGATTEIRNAEVLINTPNHTQTFGKLNMIFDPLIVAAGSTVNFLNKGDFNFDGTSLEGAGIINGNIDLRNRATLNPGIDASTGTLTINGNLKLFKNANSSDSEANFAPLINSDTDYDSVDVFGTVELIDADFEPTGSYTYSNPPQEIILINNDGTDAIVGTFEGLPEGAQITLPGTGGNTAIISYVGGDGNDVILKPDDVNPIAICQDITVSINPNETATITANDIDNGSSDNIGIVSYTINGSNQVTFDYQDLGDQIVTLTVTDALGNIGECTATVSITSSIAETDYFITKWITTSSNETITISTSGNGYNYAIDFGDANDTNGTNFQRGVTGDATHTYATPGEYIVKIHGDFPRIVFASASNRSKIREVTQWGTNNWTSMGTAFFGCINLDVTATDVPDLSNVTSVNGMFVACTSLIGNTSFNSWDVSNVEDMTQMFNGATNFNQNISNWNVSNVTVMKSMFYDTTFNQDISNWDVSKVMDMSFMFRNVPFDQDLSTWDISSVTNMREMFRGGTMSTVNYDNTLIGWATLDTGETQIPSNINFHGGSSQYCLSQFKRQELTTSYGWNITDGGELSDCTSFVTIWETTTTNESITIPTTGTGYNYVINWGDGTSDAGLTGDATHTYTTAGTYTVSILGEFPRIFFNLSGDSLKIKEVFQWGSNAWTSMELAFAGCQNLDITATDTPNLSQVTNTFAMFAFCENLIGNSSFNSWDVSNVENMDSLFFNCTNFNQDISNWNVSAVTNMKSLFTLAANFNQPIGNWNMGNVVSIGAMFEGATNFNQSLENWDVSSVDNMKKLFSGATNFNQPLANWNVSNVTNMSDMFADATNFNQDISNWNVGTVFIMNSMFLRAENFNQDLSNWDVSNVISMELMFGSATSFNQDLSNWDVSNVSSLQLMFFQATAFDQDLSSWDISSLTGINTIFTDAGLSNTNYDNTLIGWATLDVGETQIPSGITFNGGSSQYCISELERQQLIDTYGWSIADGGKVTNCNNPNSFVTEWITTGDNRSITITTNPSYTYNYIIDWGDGTIQAGNTGDVIHSYVTAGTYTVSIIGDFPAIYMNGGNGNAEAGYLPRFSKVIQWGNNSWATMEAAFKGCINLDITATDIPDLSNVTNTAEMFRSCYSMIGNPSFNSWDMSNVTNMQNMFYEAASFDQPITNWDVSSVENMNGMFNTSLFDQNIGNWDISSVTNMGSMFENSMVSTENYDTILIGWATLDAGETQIPSNINFHAGSSLFCNGRQARQLLTATDGLNWTITDGDIDPTCVVGIAPKIYLQGASINPNIGEENLMRDDLRAAGIIPTRSPYPDMVDCSLTVFDTTGNDAIVDWVWVEVHDTNDNSAIAAAQSALLQRDGDVVSIDGISSLLFNTNPENYYVVIKHRNHLGIMSLNSLALSNNIAVNVDFTDGSTATFGSNAQTNFGMPSGMQAMWTGNVNDDGFIQYSGVSSDTPDILAEVLNAPENSLNFSTYIVNGYSTYDLNMDSTTQYSGTNPDTPIILQNVLAHPGNFLNFSTYQIKEQLPDTNN